jgi:lipopolysaccharide transport system ATP-binding protein
VFNSVSPDQVFPAGRIVSRCQIPANLLNDSYYRVHVMLVRDTSVVVLQQPEAVLFEVYDVPRVHNWYGKWPGALRPKLAWELDFTEAGAQLSTARAMSSAADSDLI